MIGITVGVPIGVFVFLFIGALIGTGSGNPEAGLLPGFIAGAAVFFMCMKWQKDQHHQMQNQVLASNCSPEASFSAVKEALDATHLGSSYWQTDIVQHNLILRSVIKFEEIACGPFGKVVNVSRIIKLIATVERHGLTGSLVKLEYTTISIHGRWTVDDGITKTTRYIKNALAEASIQERSEHKDLDAEHKAIIDSVYAR